MTFCNFFCMKFEFHPPLLNCKCFAMLHWLQIMAHWSQIIHYGSSQWSQIIHSGSSLWSLMTDLRSLLGDSQELLIDQSSTSGKTQQPQTHKRFWRLLTLNWTVWNSMPFFRVYLVFKWQTIILPANIKTNEITYLSVASSLTRIKCQRHNVN